MEYYIVYGWADCPFCVSAKEILEVKQKRHMMVYLDHDDVLLEYFKKTYEHPTVPIVIKKCTQKPDTTLIGGYTDLCDHLDHRKK